MTDFFDFAFQSPLHFIGVLFMIAWIGFWLRFVVGGFELKSVNVNVTERPK